MNKAWLFSIIGTETKSFLDTRTGNEVKDSSNLEVVRRVICKPLHKPGGKSDETTKKEIRAAFALYADRIN